jgi:hypothetical protein
MRNIPDSTPERPGSTLPAGYAEFLAEVKGRVA